MTQEQITKIVQRQRAFFATGTTLSVEYRIRALTKLKESILENQNRITEALQTDLGKSSFESYMCEIGMVLSEISYLQKHIRQFTKIKKARTPVAQFSAKSYQKPMPYGVVLVMSPWNYPFLLALDPLIDAVAAGNTVVVKPSAYAPATGEVLKKLLTDIFPADFIAVITGGREENTYLLEEKFDYIFFTGSKNVGRTVLEKAAKHITPVTLELGGKSPCIVHESADLKMAARRIVFGKYLNCGQTCVAPDYILCHASVRDKLLEYIKTEIKKQYGTKPLTNKNYGKIINERHFERIMSLINPEKLAVGGESDRELLKIAPTVMKDVTYEDTVMQEEIFGPVLPVLTFTELDEVIEQVNGGEKPLALYVFASDKAVIEKVTSLCSFGGGCVNDVIIHLATSEMGFGGVGESGMGAYHGKTGFDTFTHYKSIVDKKTWVDLPMRYQPYKGVYRKLLKMFLK